MHFRDKQVKDEQAKKAIIIGSGIGGLSLGIRLQSLGFETTILEKLDGPGGRAYVRRAEGFTFDMGPTVLTVPHFIEELFALERGAAALSEPDFPPATLSGERITEGISGGPATSRYVDLVPILPFYRIYFDDGTFFDYDGNPERTREQIKALAPEDLEGYEHFHEAAKDIFERGFLELGYTYFNDVPSMLRVVPDLLRLNAVRPLFSFVKKYFKSDKMRQVFSFRTSFSRWQPAQGPGHLRHDSLCRENVGDSLCDGWVPARWWMALSEKFEELGGEIRFDSEVTRIEVVKEGKQKVAKGVTLGRW